MSRKDPKIRWSTYVKNHVEDCALDYES
eukprot:SAG31_NODE_24532_length_479_cov_1.207895_1_plen_27_part_10